MEEEGNEKTRNEGCTAAELRVTRLARTNPKETGIYATHTTYLSALYFRSNPALEAAAFSTASPPTDSRSRLDSDPST